MKTTTDLLDAVKTKRGISSDYALAKALGIAQARVSMYRTKARVMEDDLAMQIAHELQLDAGLVLTWIHAERALRLDQRDVFKALERMAGQFGKVTAQLAIAVLVGIGTLLGAAQVNPANASPILHKINSYYTFYRLGRRRRLARQLHALGRAAARAAHPIAEHRIAR